MERILKFWNIIQQENIAERAVRKITPSANTVLENTRLPVQALILVTDVSEECERDDDIREILQLLPRLWIFLTNWPELPICFGLLKISAHEHHDLALREIPEAVIEHDISSSSNHRFWEFERADHCLIIGLVTQKSRILWHCPLRYSYVGRDTCWQPENSMLAPGHSSGQIFIWFRRELGVNNGFWFTIYCFF